MWQYQVNTAEIWIEEPDYPKGKNATGGQKHSPTCKSRVLSASGECKYFLALAYLEDWAGYFLCEWKSLARVVSEKISGFGQPWLVHGIHDSRFKIVYFRPGGQRNSRNSRDKGARSHKPLCGQSYEVTLQFSEYHRPVVWRTVLSAELKHDSASVQIGLRERVA